MIEAAKNTYDLMFTDEVVSLNKLISMTHELLEESGLSNISKRSISYLYKRKDVILKKRGRKVNKNFEAELWANLMICSYESNDVEVIYHFVCTYFSEIYQLIYLI